MLGFRVGSSYELDQNIVETNGIVKYDGVGMKVSTFVYRSP
jgi:hypothetical protein